MLTFVTGNDKKRAYYEEVLGEPLNAVALELDEIQSLSLEAVLEAKARAAYAALHVPLFVDDVSFVIDELNGLPGPFVRWFIDALEPEGVCRLADITKTRTAVTYIGIGYCDERGFKAFIAEQKGRVAEHPQGTGGFGWDSIMIQDGYGVTRAELNKEEYERASIRKKALNELKSYLYGQNTH